MYSEKAKKDKRILVGEDIQLPPEEVSEAGKIVVKDLERGGFVTFLVGARHFWESKTAKAYYDLIRQKAEEGKKIRRVFILTDSTPLRDTAFRYYIEEDLKAGIDVRLILSKYLPARLQQDFGLWDCEGKNRKGIACLVRVAPLPTPDQPVLGCTFTKSQETINQFKKMTTEIWKNCHAKDAKYVLDRVKNMEMKTANGSSLIKSLPVMSEYAARYCHGGYLGTSCKWYHESWQYLKLLGLVSTPDWHREFFRTGLRESLLSLNNGRILICGLADYGMLAYVIDACEHRAGARYSVDLLDICKAPLEICLWYRDQNNLHTPILTLPVDILDDAHVLNNQLYDLIVTDAFLTRFEKADKKRIVTEWRRLLKKNGVVLTTIRVGNGGVPRVKTTKSEVTEFVGRAKKEFTKWNAASLEEDLGLDMNLIEKYAKQYAEHIVSYPVKDRDSVEQLFRKGGFAEVRVQMTEKYRGEFRPTIYAEVVAQK